MLKEASIYSYAHYVLYAILIPNNVSFVKLYFFVVAITILHIICQKHVPLDGVGFDFSKLSNTFLFARYGPCSFGNTIYCLPGI